MFRSRSIAWLGVAFIAGSPFHATNPWVVIDKGFTSILTLTYELKLEIQIQLVTEGGTEPICPKGLVVG